MRRARCVVYLAFLFCCSQPRVHSGPTLEAKAMSQGGPIVATPAESRVLDWPATETWAAPPAPEHAASVAVTPLEGKDVQRLLGRLPPLTAEPAQQTAF